MWALKNHKLQDQLETPDTQQEYQPYKLNLTPPEHTPKGKARGKTATALITIGAISIGLIAGIISADQNQRLSSIDIYFGRGEYQKAYDVYNSLHDQLKYTGQSSKLHVMSGIALMDDFIVQSSHSKDIQSHYIAEGLKRCIANKRDSEACGYNNVLLDYRKKFVGEWVNQGVEPVSKMLNLLASDESLNGFYPETDEEYIKTQIRELRNDYNSSDLERARNEITPLKIVGASLKNEGYNRWVLMGKLSNVGSKGYQFVKIRIDYFDEAGEQITYEEDYINTSDTIRPGGVKQFEISNKVIGAVAKCSYTILDDYYTE